MNKKYITLLASLAVLCITFTKLYAWGGWGHTHVNRYAVKCLPEAMQGFFGKNVDFVSEHSVDPDKRRHLDKAEGPKHYLDYDYICKPGNCVVPRRWDDAISKYGMDSLKHIGIMPWNTIRLMNELTDAFKKKDKWEILRLTSDIGHYVADIHVPFHATSNYDGQFTKQKGIHSLWESTVVEHNGDHYNFNNIATAEYIKNPADYMFDILTYSLGEVDSALAAERIAVSRFDSSKRFETTTRKDGSTRLVYTHTYTAAYQELMHNMQERKLRMAVHAVASIWYTAWVEAGKPDLNTIPDTPMPTSYKEQIDKMNEGWKDF